MSDRLTISASFSVLTMALYVLFGSHAEQASLGSESLLMPLEAHLPGTVMAPGKLLPSLLR